MYNKLLQRQLQKHFGDKLPPEQFSDFLKTISSSYEHYEQDRVLLERSIEISSEEMIELNQSEKKAHDELKTLFENIGEVFFSADVLNKRLLQISDACLEVFGYTREEFFSNNQLLSEIVFEEDLAVIQTNYQVIITGQSFSQQYRIHHKDGSIRWVETKIKPTLNSEMQLVRIDGATVDITERKAAEQKLNASELRFRSLIENSADMISMMDETGKFIYVSPEVIKKFGFTNEECLTMNAMQVIHPDDAEKAQAFLAEVFQKPGVPVNGPIIRNLRKDGTFVWVEGTITNLLNNENVNAVVANFRDISERKQAEEKILRANENLKVSFERLSEAQEIAQIGSWVYDVRSAKETRSAEYYKIFETPHGKFASTLEGYLEFIHPDDRNLVSAKFNQILLDHKPYEYESRILIKDGSVKYINNKVKCTEDENGLLIKILGTIQDITEQKIIQTKLETNIVELKKTNSELDKFVYSVSHDLRAPLCSMLGVIELAQDDTTEELILDHFKMLKGNIKKLDGFIADILDCSRNSRSSVKPENINFKELLDDVISNLKFMSINNRKVDIAIDFNNEKLFISDKNRIKSVLNNLISNAIRYQNPQVNNPFVDVKIDMSDTETHIIVKDNGIGISKENIEKIFEMFYRVSENSIGSGLGLYIVKETLTKLNGKIVVESEPGIGTMFKLNIPNLLYQ